MSPTPDAQPATENSTGRMRKTRFEKRYDNDEVLTKAIMDVGDDRANYRLEFEHTSHGRLKFQSISKANGAGWEALDERTWKDLDERTLGEIHEALRVAGRAAQDDRLGINTPLTGTDIASEIDLYDNINSEGYVKPIDADEVTANSDD